MSKQSIRFYHDHEVRAVWDEEHSKWWFSVLDIVEAITESANPRKYWSVLKTRLKKSGNELTTRCSQLKLTAADGKKYDFDEEAWTSVRGKGKNVLRSRFQVSYDIPHWKFDPFANMELFNDDEGISKTRYPVGVHYKYKKKHVVALTYRHQDVNSNDDDSEVNSHLLGLSYKYKF